MTRTERTYYLVFGLYSLSGWFLAPMYALFLLSRGLDLFQINMVLATYLIAVCVFEVPTGALADLAGRKLSFVLSCIVRMVAFSLYAFAHSFADCLIAEFIDAIGSTFANGALDAWAVDGMRAEGDGRPVDRFFARAQITSRTLMIGGGIACGYLGEHGMALPWLAAAAGFGVTALLAAVVMREERSAAPGRWQGLHRSLGRTMGEGLTAVRSAPVLLLLCTLTLAMMFGAVPAHMLWQPRVQGLTGEGVWLMGWIWALINVATVVGSAVLPRLLGRFGRERVLFAATLWRAAALVVAATATRFLPVLAGLLLMETGFGLSEPLLQAWMNDHVAAERRATVLSVRSMFGTLGGSTGLVCIGLIARGWGIPIAWIVSASVLAIAAPGFLVLGRRARAVYLSATPLDPGPLPASVSPPALG
jgi:MFS family permease